MKEFQSQATPKRTPTGPGPAATATHFVSLLIPRAAFFVPPSLEKKSTRQDQTKPFFGAECFPNVCRKNPQLRIVV